MELKDYELTILTDGQRIENEYVNKWNITYLCKKNNDSYTIAFVGLVIRKNKILFSFPKKFNKLNLEEGEKINYIEKVLKIIIFTKSFFGSFDYDLEENFPIMPYLFILDYYKKNGFYKDRGVEYKQGYYGNIEWKKTINTSKKIVTNKGIVYNPFVIKEKKSINSFIGECMKYVLSDANKYSDVLEFIYNFKMNFKINFNLEDACNKLYGEMNNHFRDEEKKLIMSLIRYMEWRTNSKDSLDITTKKFETYWESMVETYLNANFLDVKENNIVWRDNANRKMFYKPKKEYIESKEVIKENSDEYINYKIQPDHYAKEDRNNHIYIFDSKYFEEEVSHLDYKQMAYHYIIKHKYPDSRIVNGLILPTEKEYYSKVHVDRSDLDGLKIVEHYIKLIDVIDFTFENIERYKKNIYKNR